jgi:hypothetical protein
LDRLGTLRLSVVFRPVAVLACFAVVAGSAAAASFFPNQQRLTALYVMDHNGVSPPTYKVLVPYSAAFQKILGGCHTAPDALTMITVNTAEQATEVGGRKVTNLMMLKAFAHYITWRTPQDCTYVYRLSEAHLENGQPY